MSNGNRRQILQYYKRSMSGENKYILEHPNRYMVVSYKIGRSSGVLYILLSVIIGKICMLPVWTRGVITNKRKTNIFFIANKSNHISVT